MDSLCEEVPLTPSYGRALIKWNKFAFTRILQSTLMKEQELKKAQNERDRIRRKSRSGQHVQKNGVIYKGTVVRQIEEQRVDVTNQALVHKCKQMDKIWAKFMKELPKLVKDHLWSRLCH
jgi:hypothetical protein